MVATGKKPAAKPEAKAKPGAKVKVYVLDATREAELTRAVKSLPREGLVRVPPYLQARLTWMGALQALALKDQAGLVRVPLDGGDLTPDELDRFGYEIEFLRKSADAGTAKEAGDQTDETASEGRETETLAELRPKIRDAQKVILRAFDLRFREDPEGRALLRDIRRGEGDDDAVRDSTRILALIEDPAHRAWFARLPKGEPALARELGAWTATFVQRRKEASDASAARALRALRDGAYTLAARTADRLQAAGRYLVSGDPARKGDYLKFQPPRRRKPRAKKVPVAPK